MAAPRDGLLSEYLGAVSGGQLVDSAGNGLHAAITGGITEGSDHPFGICAHFDGTGYATLPSGAYPTGVNNWTIALWFYQPTRASSWEAMLEIGRFAHQERIGCLIEGNTWNLVLTDDDDKAYHNVGDYTGNWHFLAWKWDGTTTTCYYDSATPSETYTIHNFDIYDAGIIGASFGGSNRYSGKMARIRIYDRALSSDEIYGLIHEHMHRQAMSSSWGAADVRVRRRSLFSLGHLATLQALFGAASAARSCRCEFAYAQSQYLARSCPFALTRSLRVACGAAFSLQQRTVLRNRRHIVWRFDPDPLPPDPVTLHGVLDGQPVSVLRVELANDETAFAIHGTITLCRAEDFLQVQVGSELQVQVGDVTVALLVDTFAREVQFGEAVYRLEGTSPASRLAEPFALPLKLDWRSVTASEIAQELCDVAQVTLDWRIVDWTVTYFEAQDQTPMEALVALITPAAMAVSDHAGVLVVDYLYPISPSRYTGATPDLVVQAEVEVISASQEAEYAPGYNAVDIVRGIGGDGSLLQLSEWRGPDGDDDDLMLARGQKMVAVITWPYQEVTLLTSGCETSVFAQGKQEYEHTETVEVVHGCGSLSYPADQVLAFEWRCDDLGAVEVSGTEVIAGDASCSLCRITYSFSVQLFLVESRSMETCQVYTQVQDDGVVQQSMVQAVRGAGDKLAPEIIADEHVQSLAVMRELGRVYLDQKMYQKDRFTLQSILQGPPNIGALVEAKDLLGGSVLAKVTGWSVSAQWGESASLSLELERSLT